MRYLLTSLSILFTFPLMVFATETPVEEDEIDLVKQCVINELINADDNTLVADIKEKCSKLEAAEKFSLLDQRMARERVTQKNRNVLTPHHRNYILPVSYISQPNNRPFDGIKAISDEQGEPLDNFEVKYQLSLKVPIYTGFSDPDQAIYTAFTLQSYWQFYNKDISSPFRETNYEPEVFWVNFLDDENVLWGDEMAVVVGLSHQSNGRSQPNSRSWNRLYANFIWENRGFVF